MTFTRAYLAANTQSERSIAKTGNVPIIYAYHNTQKALTYHDVRGSKTLKDIQNGLVSGNLNTINGTALPDLLTYHGVLMMSSWGLLLPAGVIIAHYNRHTLPKGWWFTMHKYIQYTGWLLQLVGFIMAFVYKTGSHFKGQGIAEVHMLLGVIVVSFGT
jgi:hypothetical protein